jgi:hypothetical protein
LNFSIEALRFGCCFPLTDTASWLGDGFVESSMGLMGLASVSVDRDNVGRGLTANERHDAFSIRRPESKILAVFEQNRHKSKTFSAAGSSAVGLVADAGCSECGSGEPVDDGGMQSPRVPGAKGVKALEQQNGANRRTQGDYFHKQTKLPGVAWTTT